MVKDLSPVSCLALASVADPTGDYHKLHQGDYTRNRAEYNGSYFSRNYGEIHFDSPVFHIHVGAGSLDI